MGGGVGEHEAAHALAGIRREPLADHAALRDAAPMRPLDAEMVEDGEGVLASRSIPKEVSVATERPCPRES